MEKFTHGIIVVDPLSEDEEGNMEIVHFVGYWKEPTENDYTSLVEELKADEEFGLTETWDKMKFGEAPKDIVDQYWEAIKDQEEDELEM